MRNRFRASMAGAIFLASCGLATAQSYVGKEFPEFTAKDSVSGESISLKSLRGSIVLIDFWATW